MNILEYDQVDPHDVLHLNLLSLGYPLTPELAARLRRLDPRVFPCFGVYAVEDGVVAGQVLLYRMPVQTTGGPDEVGAIAAVCTHPAYGHRGIGACLIQAAHDRMRAAGLRISTLRTARHRIAHLLYRRVGYEDGLSFGSAFASIDRGAASTLKAERAGIDRLVLADDLFRRLAVDHLGFARRHEPFFPHIARCGDLDPDHVWLIFDGGIPVGYAIAGCGGSILTVSDLLLEDSLDPQATAIALARATGAEYVQVMLNSRQDHEYFGRAGYRLAQPAWGTFMIKPLREDLTTMDVCHLLGIGTDRFLTSWLDNS